jgi:hypothetical protein
MQAAPRPGFVTVAVREAIWIWRDKVALLLVAGIPLIAFALQAATFSNAVIRDLRVDVVDQDRSRTSMGFVQAIASAPGVTVAGRHPILNGAMHAVRSGEAIASLHSPRDLERDIMGARRPQIVIFFNKQFFTPGNVGSAALGPIFSGHRRSAGRTAWGVLHAGPACRRAMRPPTGAELRTVPAARDPADRPSGRGRHRRRLCCRLEFDRAARANGWRRPGAMR